MHVEPLTAAALAAMLTGRQYRRELTRDEERQAKAAGLVVVFGASDDLIEFRGAINDECGCGEVRVTPLGVLGPWEDVDHSDEEAAEDYFRKKLGPSAVIESQWCKVDGWSWAYKTAIPHETFEVMDDGERYCRGIVFRLADVGAPAAASA